MKVRICYTVSLSNKQVDMLRIYYNSLSKPLSDRELANKIRHTLREHGTIGVENIASRVRTAIESIDSISDVSLALSEEGL